MRLLRILTVMIGLCPVTGFADPVLVSISALVPEICAMVSSGRPALTRSVIVLCRKV